MKKILIALGVLISFTCIARAEVFVNDCIYKSSYTVLSGTASITSIKYLKSVVVSSPTAGGTVGIYDNATSTASGKIGVISTNNAGVFEYNLYILNGLTYEGDTNTNGVTIIYRQ